MINPLLRRSSSASRRLPYGNRLAKFDRKGYPAPSSELKEPRSATLPALSVYTEELLAWGSDPYLPTLLVNDVCLQSCITIGMVTNKELNANRGPGCWGILANKKYSVLAIRAGELIKCTIRKHDSERQSAHSNLITPSRHLAIPPNLRAHNLHHPSPTPTKHL